MNTLATPHTIAVVDLILANDKHISSRIRKQALALLSHGSTAETPTDEKISAQELADIIDMHVASVNKWRRGLVPHLGPFPFTVIRNPFDKNRYLRHEAFAYNASRFAAQATAPGSSQ